MTYNPQNDSSLGTDTYRPTADEPYGYDGLILLVNQGECHCGCQTKVNRKFRQGHDQRLRGKLLRAAAHGVEVTVIRDGVATSSDPPSLLAQMLGVKPGATTTTTQSAKQEPVTIKIGRWTYPATIVSQDTLSTVYEYTTRSGEIKRHEVKVRS